MKIIGTAKLAHGNKVQILSDAVEKLRWDKGVQLAEFVSDDGKYLCIRKLDEVANGEKIKWEKEG